jgi:HEAT repeat protein
MDLFEIQPGEGSFSLLALGVTFFHGVSSIYLFSTASALFLTYFEAADLPYTYIGGAFTVLLVGAAYGRLQKHLPLVTLVLGTLLCLLATLVFGRIWLTLGNPAWASVFLAIWTVAYTTLTYMSIWGLFGQIFDTRQAKRLFGLFGAAEFAADIVSGFVTPLFVALFGSSNLLWIAAAGLGLCVFFLFALTRRHRPKDDSKPGRRAEKEHTALDLKHLFKDRYALLLHLLWGLSLMGFYLMDTAFNNQVERHYSDTQDAMTSFFGVFFAVGSTINMLMESFLSGRILSRLGILRVLFILPLGLLAACLGLGAGPLFVSRVGGFVFCLAVGAKMYDYVVRNALHDLAFQVLYQPLPTAKRFAVTSSVLTRAEPVAALIGGGLLLLGKQSFQIDAPNVALVLLGVLPLWLLFTVFLKGRYLQVLLAALKKRRFGLSERDLADQSGRNLLLGWLESRHPFEVIYALELLEKHEPQALARRLLALLGHPSAEVVLHALSGIARLKPAEAFEAVRALVLDASRPAGLRAKALITLAALDEARAMDLLGELVRDDAPELVRGAMIGLLRHCGIEGVLLSGERLLSMLRAKDAALRESAARILGEVGNKSFHRTLRELLRDPDPLVRRAALASAERMPDARLAPLIVPYLADQHLRGLAVRALAAMGRAALPELALAFTRPGQDLHVVLGIAKAVGRMPEEEATDFLVEHIVYPSVTVRHAVLERLLRRGFAAGSEEDRAILRRILDNEAAHATALLACLAPLAGNPELAVPAEAVRREIALGVDRILALLSFLSPSLSMREVQRNLKLESREKQAYALEMLDSVVSDEIKRLVFPLLEGISEAEKLERMSRRYPQQPRNLEQALAEIARSERAWVSGWTRAAAMYTAARLRLSALGEALGRLPDTGEPLVAETRTYALAVLAGRPAAE